MDVVKQIGRTVDGHVLLGGAFMLADTMGMPLADQMRKAEQIGARMSLPHYFACALEAGWSHDQAFLRLHEALQDQGRGKDWMDVEQGVIHMFMETKKRTGLIHAVDIARALREELEA